MIRALAHSGAHFSPRRRDKFIGASFSNENVAQSRAQPTLNGCADNRSNGNEEQSRAQLTPGRNGGHSRDSRSKQKEAHGDSLSRSTESVLVASVLIASVTFAAAFTMPGSYKNRSPKEGTPALGSRYGFKVFLVADIFAFFFAVAATFSLAEYGTRGNVDPLVRCAYARRAVGFFHVALKSIIVAFVLGVSVVMWDISVSATAIVAVLTTIFVLYGNVPIGHDLRLLWVMYHRFGFSCSQRLHPSTSAHLDWTSWWLKSVITTLLLWNLVKLLWAYISIYGLAYAAQLKQKS